MRPLIALIPPLLLVACSSVAPIPDARPGADSTATSAEPFIHLSEPFETEAFREVFAMDGANPEVSVVPSPDQSRTGNVLKVRIPARQHTGANFSWVFRDHPSGEPTRLYSRYFVRFEPGWDSGEGGKLPGPSGTYGRGGWGGRQADGTNGWSARMGFKTGWREDETQLIYYAYHADTATQWGQAVYWDRTTHLFSFESVGSLKHGQWYCVESYIQLNDPDRHNGRLVGWIDEKLATDYQGLRFRTTPELAIEKYWFNVYYGGTGTPSKDLVLYFDDLLLSDTRLGCDVADKQ